MGTWEPGDLDLIGGAREVSVSSRRDDGSYSKPVTIWVVRVGDELYVRSVEGEHGGWYRGAQGRHVGRIETGGAARDVEFVGAGDERVDEIDAAYREKYASAPDSVERMVAEEAKATTLRVVST